MVFDNSASIHILDANMFVCSFCACFFVFFSFFRAIFFCLSFRSKAFVFFFSFSILGFQFYDLPNIRRLDDKWKKKRRNKIKETSTIWNMYKKNRNKIFAQSVCAMHATPTPLKYCYYYFQLNEAGFRWNLSAFFHHIRVFFSIDGFSIFRCLFLFNSS